MTQVQYRVLGPLSPGSSSRAQLGLAVEPDGSALPVVLIFAPEEVTSDPDAVTALERETLRATQLEHPHISRVHGLARLEQGLARVTEYGDGESLRTVLERGGRIPVAIAARLVADIAQGVHYAHLAGNDDGTPLVHGDLRPETVMLAFSGNCKVTGYGALSVAPREKDGRRVVNRRLYCAPEQVVGGRESVIVATDVFLIGLILHECLSGNRPFSEAADLDQAVLMGSLGELPAEVPPALAQVIERCTAKKAAGRYPSVLAVREAILEALGNVALPTDVQVAEWLQPLCPPTEVQRVARQQTIDQGIARYAQEHWARKRAAPPEPPVTRPAPVAPAAAPASPVAVTSPSAAPVGMAGATLPSAPASGRASFVGRHGIALSVAAVLLVVAGVAVVGLRPQTQPMEVEPPEASALQEPSAVDAGLAVAVPAGDVDAGEARAQPPDAGTEGDTALAQAVPDAGGEAAAAAPVDGFLQLDSEPVATVSSGGRVLGRTPLRVKLPAGRHVLSLSNKARNLDVTRTVHVAAGETSEHALVFQRGYLTVNAPSSAKVLLDGRAIGQGTLREVGVYEGTHKLTVLANGQRWEERFTVTANQRVNFDVGIVDE